MANDSDSKVIELVGAHKNSEAYISALNRSGKADTDIKEETAFVKRQEMRKTLANKAGDAFSVGEKLVSGDIHLLNSIANKEEFYVRAYNQLSSPEVPDLFKRAVIKECEKKEVLEVLVQAKSLPLSDSLKAAMQNARDRIMISLGHAGDVKDITRFYVRSGAAPAQKKALRL